MKNKRILIVVTSSDHTKNDKPTGLHLEEYAVPYMAFQKAGAEITVASPKGGQPPVDPGSPPTDDQKKEWKTAIDALEKTKRVAEINPDQYDAVYFPGGHGTMFDFPDNPHIAEILENFDANRKVVGAVCHGPAAFIGAKKANGDPFAKDRTVNSFTDAEERQVEMVEEMPFLLESKLRENGALFKSGPNMQGFAVRDKNLVTGQNPPSAPKVAEGILEALNSPISR